jgi:hypothetical protein
VDAHPRSGQHAHDPQAIRPRPDSDVQLAREEGRAYAERQVCAVDEVACPTTCRRTRCGVGKLFYGRRRITRQHLEQSPLAS